MNEWKPRGLLITPHFGGDLRDLTGDGLSGAFVVRHLELDRVSDAQVFDVSLEMSEVEKETGLAIATLNETV